MAEIISEEYRCIDTRVFDRCIKAKTQYTRKLAELTTRYEKTVAKLKESWQGQGADAFFNDAQKVRTNLKGIADILGNMCNVMEECRTVIANTDKSLGDFNRNPDQE